MKKRNKIISFLLAGAMAMGMCVTVYAEPGTVNPPEGTEENPAEAAITKTLQMPEGVEIPQEGFTFSFDFTATGFEGGAARQDAPDLDTTISFAATDDDSTTATDGLIKITKETGDIFDGKTFPAAGVYTYTVLETGEDAVGYGMDYSEATYTMNVYVKNKADETGTYVYSVTTTQNTDDSGAETGTKVDPEPGDTPGEGNGFAFVNSYTQGRGNPEDPESNALEISKTVAGEYGDHTKEFTFNVTLTKAALAEAPEDGYVGKVGDTEYKFVPGTATTVTMKHGDELTFKELPAGTKYTVTETGTENYTASAVTVENAGTPENAPAVEEGANLTVSDKLVGAKGNNSTAFTNTYDDASVTPTGIIINNLPFVILIVVAAAGISLYVISRRRFSR